MTLSKSLLVGLLALTISAPAVSSATDITAKETKAFKNQVQNINSAIDKIVAAANATDGVTAGTVAASKAVVVDSNKDIGDFRNLDATNLDAGASGTAGSVDVFPATATSGKVSLTAANSAGDYTLTIVNASLAAARTVTIPDPGGAALFVMTEGAATVNGVKTFGSIPIFPTGGITIGSTTVTETLAGYLASVPSTLDFYPATLTTSFNAIAASVCKDSEAIPVTGAALYDPCDLGADPDEAAKNISFSCFVSATDEAKIHLCNHTSTSIDIASGTYKIRVLDQ